MLDLEVETGALDGVRANLAVGNGNMVGMDGIAFQGLGTFERAVEHDVGIGRCQTAVDVNLDVEKTGNLA